MVISGERSRGRGKIEEGNLEVQTTRFKLSKIPEYTVPHSKYSQCFIITLYEIQSIKMLNYYIVTPEASIIL